MTSPSGYAFQAAPSRRQELLASISFNGTAAEAVPDFIQPRNALLICLLSFENEKITHIARGSKGRRAATGLTRLNFNHVVSLSEPVSHRAIREAVEPKMRHLVIQKLAESGVLPPATSSAILGALRDLSPTARDFVDRYVGDRAAVVAEMSGAVRRALAYQKDTVGTALTIAGFERDEFAAWQPLTSHPVSFLEGLPQVVVREDSMVVSDMMKVPGFDLVKSTSYSAAVFQSDRVRLTVVLANHLPLERQLGADLIYYNETYKSFVVVQYKAMESSSGSRPIFRFPSEQLTIEIARMDEVNNLLRASPRNPVLHGFRLLENPFFMKLCPRVVLDPNDVGLLPGMYIPLDFWKLIEVDQAFVGKRGGRAVTFENLDRYFENTTFISLVANGWVGTNIDQTAVLETIVAQILQTGHSLTLAVKTGTDANPMAGDRSS